MKSKTPIFLTLFILCLLCSSCSHYYYAPNMVNAPLFQKKNETRLNVAASYGTEFSAIELQGAHAFSDHIAGMLNFASGGADDGNGQRAHGTYAEAGTGYFYPFAKYFVAESYGGFGFGGMRNEYGSANNYSSVTFFKPWIQPDIGIRFSFFELAFSTRLAVLNYLSVKSFGVPEEDRSDFDILNSHRSSLLFEPAVTIRLGWKYVLLQIQVAESYNSVAYFPQEIINENIGLIFTIPPLKSNTAKNNLQ